MGASGALALMALAFAGVAAFGIGRALYGAAQRRAQPVAYTHLRAHET